MQSVLPAGLALALALAVPPAPAGRPARAAPRNPVEEGFSRAVAALERDGRSARAVVPLAELADLEEELPVLARLAPVYARVAADREALPEVRALARHRLAGLERSRGNLQRSAAHLARLGFVVRWTVVGPFDDEGKRGFDTAYPPERSLDLEVPLPGKVREVSWRPLPAEAVVDGFVHLGAALRPTRETVAYALAVLESPREERVQLWLGASGASKVWVNGALALSDPGYHPARLDQMGAAVTLRRGPNRILVKLCHAGGRMGFTLRLSDARGEPRTLPAASLPPLPSPVAPGPPPARIPGIVAALEARARAASTRTGARARRAEAEARRDLALALHERASADLEERRARAEARRAAELAPEWTEARLLAARLEDDASRRREHLEAALAADPEEPRALLALAREETMRDRSHQAVRLLDRAVALAPGWAAARVARVEALDRVGFEARAALAAAEAARDLPTAPRAVEAGALWARRLGRLDEAAWLLRKGLALRHDDGAARAALAQLLLDRGEVAGALALYAEALRLDPSDVELRLRLADVLAANGRDAEAEEAHAAAIRIAPEEAEAWERRGRARLAAGKEALALADLKTALELRPQSPALKELVRSLAPERERFETPWILDGPALARDGAAPAPGEDALVLADRKVTRVFRSGLSSTFVQVVLRAATQRGADELRRQSIGYDPSRQEVRVIRARVIRPDGGTVETYEERERSASEPWYRLYYDTRVRVLSFPALAPGDALEVAWRVDDVAGENLLSDYFGDLTPVEGEHRKASLEYVVLVPGERRLHANDVPGLERTTRTLPDGTVEHRWSAREVPRIVPEPRMPGFSEVSRYVHVSTYADWDQVARFYWDLVREQLRPTDEVRAAAAGIAREALGERAAAARAAGGRRDPESERALVGAVYDFVVTQTRYVGLEFGIHGYKPYRVEQVLSRRFGDCKDKASLMHALLASLGIDSRLVLLRMRRLGGMPEHPASLAVFNHAILRVPSMDLWLDGTAAYTGSRELPGEDRGATVLVVNPGEPAWFGTVPEALPEENEVESTFRIALDPDGSARVRGSSRVAGAQASSYRRAYETANDRRSVLEQAFNRTFPGLEVREVTFSDLGRLEADVAMEFELSVPRYAGPDGRFTPFGAGNGYAEAFAAASAREHDLVLGDPGVTRFAYRYALPAGWTVAELPAPASAETPWAAFAVRYRAEGGELEAEGHVTFRVSRVPAGDYPAFRAFLGELDRALGRRVRVVPGAPEVAR
jgi:tetratricopeptide (TPR) repeat protein/transglutaminase-like putative cysteine protease